MSNYYTWKQDIEVISFAGLKPFLVNLAESNRCGFKILKDNSTFWKDKLTVEFSGTTENLTTLKEEFILSVTKYNLPGNVTTADYNVQSIEEEESNYIRELNLKVNASKRTDIESLVEAVADELMLAHEVNEKSNGFLKGKTVNVTVLGDWDKLPKFKAIFESVIEDSKLRKQKKLKR